MRVGVWGVDTGFEVREGDRDGVGVRVGSRHGACGCLGGSKRRREDFYIRSVLARLSTEGADADEADGLKWGKLDRDSVGWTRSSERPLAGYIKQMILPRGASVSKFAGGPYMC